MLYLLAVNERTTVASAYALAQFIDGPVIRGTGPGLQNAAAMVQNLIDPTTGVVGTALATSPNGDETSTLPRLNSLANLVAACVASPAACTSLLDQVAQLHTTGGRAVQISTKFGTPSKGDNT